MDLGDQSSASSQNSPTAPSQKPSAATLKSDAARIRRRNRMITSCLECRRRKLKCDKLHPCTNCSKFNRDCVFLAPALDTASQQKLADIKEKMGSLERVLEHDVARNREQAAGTGRSLGETGPRALPGQHATVEGEGAPASEEERKLEITPLAIQDAAYEDDADDSLVDLGFKYGKMRVTERIGDYFRPKMAEELTIALNDKVQTRISPEQRFDEGKSPVNTPPPASFLEPGPTFIAPHAGLFVGLVERSGFLSDVLPSKPAADRLLQHYHVGVHAIARVVHWPSLQLAYENFWMNIFMGVEPPASVQALIFAILFSGAVSVSEEVCTSTFGVSSKKLIENFQQATEMALSKASFLRTTKVETFQALVIYLIPMCRSELSRAHCALVAAAIRLGECMGLHKDPTHYGLSPVGVHVRRLLWYQLCFLDVRTCEAYGPRPLIRRDEYDTEMPVNMDEDDLVSASEIQDQDRWTDMTLIRIRFEDIEMRRQVWVDRIRLEKKQVTLTYVLGRIEAFRKALDERYLPMLDGSNSLHRYARCVMLLGASKLHIMVLHRYHYSFGIDTPDRLRQVLISSGIQNLEAGIELLTNPDLARWSWYTGALQQFHIALLLLVEIFSFPMHKEADRIWKCIDYIFDADANESRPVKGRRLLSELRDRFIIYRNIRKMRTPLALVKPLEGSAKGPGAYADKKRTSRSAPEIQAELPLGIKSTEWQSVNSVSQQPQVSRPDERNQTPTELKMAARAAKSDWGFQNVTYRLPPWKSPTASTPDSRPISVSPSLPQSTPDRSSSALEPSDRPLGQKDLGPSMARPSLDPYHTLQDAILVDTEQATDQDLMNDINWNEWDQLFPLNATPND